MVRSHNIPHSAVVDLNGVNTKLLATEHKKRPREASPASLDRITEILDDMENGKVLNHRDLVGIGGRPAYPIQLLNQIWENPRIYSDIFLLFCFLEYEWENPTIFPWQKSKWDLYKPGKRIFGPAGYILGGCSLWAPSKRGLQNLDFRKNRGPANLLADR